MENIVIKAIETYGVPGIIIAILYFIWKQEFISIIKSSDTERLFFTHEKKQVYRAFNWIALFLITFVLVAIVAFLILPLIPKYKFITILQTKVVINLLFIFSILISIVLFFIRKRKKELAILKSLNENDSKFTLIFAVYYTITIIYVAYTVSTGVKALIGNNKELTIIMNIGIICLFLPGFLKSLISPWILRERIIFSFNQDGDVWIIQKILNDNEFLIGDICEEVDCKKVKFISYEEIKKKDILIEKIKID